MEMQLTEYLQLKCTQKARHSDSVVQLIACGFNNYRICMSRRSLVDNANQLTFLSLSCSDNRGTRIY